jgi:hypothetical protein
MPELSTLPPLLFPEEIHAFGLKCILEALQEYDKVTITRVDPQWGREPQVLGTRWGRPEFITVRTAMCPSQSTLTTEAGGATC